MEMTKQQERCYQFHRELGWEFSHCNGDMVIMELWRQDTMESRSLFATVAITQDGGHKQIEENVKAHTPRHGEPQMEEGRQP